MARNEELFNLLINRDDIDLDVRTLDGHTALYYALISTANLISTNSFAARLVEKGALPNPVILTKSVLIPLILVNNVYKIR